MKRIKVRLFWSYDVIKTQKWLDRQSELGFKLIDFIPFLRMFVFNKAVDEKYHHIIIYEKSSNGSPSLFIENSDYKEVLHTKNYYFLQQLNAKPKTIPSYEPLLNKNSKIKYIVGIILLVIVAIYIPIFTAILSSIISGNFSFEWGGWDLPGTTYTTQEIIKSIFVAIMFYSILFIILFSPFWMIYTYLKLNKTNKELEKLCGNTKAINFTIPTDRMIDKKTLSIHKKQGDLIKKTKIGWVYSPDITVQWLEKMEAEGFNLLSMSNLGNSFYFIKGETKKVKYHVDFQIKKTANYLSINEENGWKLFFTSITKYFAFTVWSKAYEDDIPEFYSNHEDTVSHARKYMITYASIYIFLGIIYASVTVLFGYTIWTIIPEYGVDILLLNIPIIFLFFTILYFYYAIKVIRFYYRVRDNKLLDSQ